MYDDYGSAGRTDRQYFGVLDWNRSAIGQVDIKGLKRQRLVHLADLFNRHVDYSSQDWFEGNNARIAQQH